MTFIHGKSARVFWGANDLSTYFSEFNVAAKADTAETTTFTAQSKTYVVGVKDGTISVKGFFDGDAGAVDDYLASVLGVDAGQVWTGCNQSIAVGVVSKQCSAMSTEYAVTAPVNDVVSTSGSVQADGGVDTGVILAPAVSLSTTTNGTGVDNAASTANGGVAHLHVPVNTRNGTNIVKVQHSTDNVTYADLVTFTTVGSTTETAQRVVVAAGTTVNRYLRYQDTVAGTTGAATIVVAFARR